MIDPNHAIHLLIKSGQLKRPEKCRYCGKKDFIIAHHPDYALPYKTAWICRSCHSKMHKQIKAQNRHLMRKRDRNKKPLPLIGCKNLEIFQISSLLPGFD